MISLLAAIADSALSPRAIRVLHIVGRLWPEVSMLAYCLNAILFFQVRAFMFNHPKGIAAALLTFVFVTHQETPLFKVNR